MLSKDLKDLKDLRGYPLTLILFRSNLAWELKYAMEPISITFSN
jgi:hypothetical protein